MGLANYTTKVDPDVTIGQIQRLLARKGATKIMLDYDDDGMPVRLEFVIQSKVLGEQYFRLPANVAGVLARLEEEAAQGVIPRAFSRELQAARVAWRIILDWVTAQCAFIESAQASLEEVMLPYMLVDEHGRTAFQVYVDKYKALPAGRGA